MDDIVLEIFDPEASLGLPILTLAEKGEKGENGSIVVLGEVPSGAIDGVNADFISAFDFVPESVEVIANGLLQSRIDEFNTSGTRNIHLNFSPQIGERILISYLRT
jgi:hypothetical protein